MISRLFCSSNEGIRETACKCIPQVLRCAREDSEKRSSLLKEIIKQLRDVMDCEYETSLLIVELECMNVCISDGGEFLNDMEFEFLCNQLMGILEKSEQRKMKLMSEVLDREEESDTPLKNLLPADYKMEERLHLEVARVLGSINKSHPDKALTFSAWMYTNVIPKAFEDLSQTLLVQFGMILLQDIVRYIGYLRFHQKWTEIINVFLSQKNHPSIIIQKAALHGLSCIASATPSSVIIDYIEQMKEAAIEVLRDRPNDLERKSHCPKQLKEVKESRSRLSLQEYGVDLLGNLLKLHGSLLPDELQLMQQWMNCLPIQFEKKIAEDQHQIYMQYLLLQIKSIQNESEDSLLKKFQLLAHFYDPKICSPFMKPTLDSFLREFLQSPAIANAFASIFNKLSSVQQKRLSVSISKQQLSC